MTTANNQNDAYNGSVPGGGPTPTELGKAAVLNGDTPDYLIQKIYAVQGVHVEVITAGPGFNALLLKGNYVAGDNVEILPSGGAEDPLIISFSPGPAVEHFGIISMPLASCRGAIGIPNINNGGGSVLATLTAIPSSFICNKLECFVKQTGSGLCVMALYDINGVMLGKTNTWAPSAVGFKTMPIAFDSANNPITNVNLLGATAAYFAIWGNSAANGAQFYSMDSGITFGPSPWIGWVVDNCPSIPATLAGGGSESSQRFSISAKA
jgi:hypothetical protein